MIVIEVLLILALGLSVGMVSWMVWRNVRKQEE